MEVLGRSTTVMDFAGPDGISINATPSEFVTTNYDRNKLPSSKAGTIIFMFDPEKNYYTIRDFESDISYIRYLLKNNSIPLSLILRPLAKIKNASKSKDVMTPTATTKIYTQAMILLYIVVALFLVFFILVIGKTYYFPNSSLEIFAVPFSGVGLLLSFVVIVLKGKCNCKILKRSKARTAPTANFRHEIFAILNKYNKIMSIHGLEWRIADKGTCLILNEKRAKITMNNNMSNTNLSYSLRQERNFFE